MQRDYTRSVSVSRRPQHKKKFRQKPPIKKRCMVVNKEGQCYEPVPAPHHNGASMLTLCPVGKGYIFGSRNEAKKAFAHTIEWCELNKMWLDKADYNIVDYDGVYRWTR